MSADEHVKAHLTPEGKFALLLNLSQSLMTPQTMMKSKKPNNVSAVPR
jgi:hypothetical protein